MGGKSQDIVTVDGSEEVLLYTASGFDPISGINQWTTLVKAKVQC